MDVESLMTRDVFTCAPTDSLALAARVMWDEDVGIVPVVLDRRLIGVITDRDVAMACMLEGRPAARIQVGGVMSEDLVTCAPGDPVEEAEEKMRRFRVRRLPVVDAAFHVKGLLSLNDLANAMQIGTSAPGVPAEDIALTLRAVCSPRMVAA